MMSYDSNLSASYRPERFKPHSEVVAYSEDGVSGLLVALGCDTDREGRFE